MFTAIHVSILLSLVFYARREGLQRPVPVSVIIGLADPGAQTWPAQPSPASPAQPSPAPPARKSYTVYLLQALSIALLALGIHEAGHLAGSRLLRQPIGDFHLAPFGIAARLPETHRPGRTKRCLVIAAGPLANLLAFGIFAWMDRFGTAFQVMAVSNLLMAAFNLLPALPMDGGWLIYHLLETMIDEMAAIRGMLGLTAVTGLFLTGAGIFQVLVSRGNASLLLAGGFILYTAWKEAPQVRIMRTARLLMRNMDGKGPPVPGRATLTVAPSCSRPADIFRFFSQNRCNLVLVLDETREMKPMGLLSETRLGRIALSGNRQETLGQILTDENRQRDGWM